VNAAANNINYNSIRQLMKTNWTNLSELLLSTFCLNEIKII